MNQGDLYQQGGYIPPTNYGNAPLMQERPVLNQRSDFASPPSSTEIENMFRALRTHPQFVRCPYCKTQAMTKCETSISIPNICCCLCFAVGPWVIFQACRAKDVNCYDASHYCVRCGKQLGAYTAC